MTKILLIGMLGLLASCSGGGGGETKEEGATGTEGATDETDATTDGTDAAADGTDAATDGTDTDASTDAEDPNKVDDALNGLYVIESWLSNPYSCTSPGLHYVAHEGKGVELAASKGADGGISLDLKNCSGNEPCSYPEISFDTKTDAAWTYTRDNSTGGADDTECWLSYYEDKIYPEGDKVVIERKERVNRDVPVTGGCEQDGLAKKHLAELDWCGLTKIVLAKRTGPAAVRPAANSIVSSPFNGKYKFVSHTLNEDDCDSDGAAVTHQASDRVTLTAKVAYDEPSGVLLWIEKDCAGDACDNALFAVTPTVLDGSTWKGEGWGAAGSGCGLNRKDLSLTLNADEITVESRWMDLPGITDVEPTIKGFSCFDHVLLEKHRDALTECTDLNKAVLKKVP